MGRYVEHMKMAELTRTFPEITEMCEDVLNVSLLRGFLWYHLTVNVSYQSVFEETLPPTAYASMTDYSAFKLHHLAASYRNLGYVSSRVAIMGELGASITHCALTNQLTFRTQ